VIAHSAPTLRPARDDDAERLFHWRNEPLIVVLSSSQTTVDWPAHVKWFADALSSPARRIFIIEKDGEAIGQVRFDRSDVRTCVISVYLVGEHIGRKLGPAAIREACRLIFAAWDASRVLACVRGENVRAQAAFARAGFAPAASGECPDDHVAMALERPAVESSKERTR